MKFAVISDIHSNLEALLAVLKHIEKEKIERIYCLGDLVGYGPNPNECVDLIKSFTPHVIIGNHDSAVIGKTPIKFFNEYAKQSTIWTRKTLTKDNLEYLNSLPLSIRENDFLFVHAAPYIPEKWTYVMTDSEASRQFRYFLESNCFIGHTHKAEFFVSSSSGRRIINPGSVGQPRDGNPKACYLIYDTETNDFRHIRLEYDVRTVYKKIVNAGLHSYLAERLLIGR